MTYIDEIKKLIAIAASEGIYTVLDPHQDEMNPRFCGEGAPDWWGIVEEGFPTEALTTPHAFYDAVGDDLKFRRNLKAMMDSCNAFLSVKKVDSHPMSEYRFF